MLFYIFSALFLLPVPLITNFAFFIFLHPYLHCSASPYFSPSLLPPLIFRTTFPLLIYLPCSLLLPLHTFFLLLIILPYFPPLAYSSFPPLLKFLSSLLHLVPLPYISPPLHTPPIPSRYFIVRLPYFASFFFFSHSYSFLILLTLLSLSSLPLSLSVLFALPPHSHHLLLPLLIRVLYLFLLPFASSSLLLPNPSSPGGKAPRADTLIGVADESHF